MPIEENKDNKNYEEASFSDVLSAIVTGATTARATCDQEVTHIAQMYKQDEYLKSFSVPRLRIDNILVDIPLNVCGLKKSQQIEIDTSENICKNILESLKELLEDKEIIKNYLASIANISLNDKENLAVIQINNLVDLFFDEHLKPTNRLKECLENIKNGIRNLQQKIQRNKDFKLCLSQLQVIIEIKNLLKRNFNSSFEVADYSDYTKEEKDLKNKNEEEQLKILKSKHIYEIVNYISQKIIYKTITKEEIKPDILVDVITDKVKNKTTPDTMLRIQIKMREEGMVWQNYKSRNDKDDNWNLTLE